jgi:hypothetical protein
MLLTKSRNAGDRMEIDEETVPSRYRTEDI